MAAAASSPGPVGAPASTAAPPEHAEPQPKPRWPWLKYATPLAVVLLAIIVVVTITRDWNAWEGGRVEQVTDDAFVRGDLTPLSTKVAGIVGREGVGLSARARRRLACRTSG